MALSAAAVALAAVLLAAFATWLVSLARRDVSIVDSLWGPMIALAPWAYLAAIAQPGPRATLVLALASVWALRLALHITWRNRGRGEDRRYQAIRARNEPHFAYKSLYLVFGLQAVLAWIVALPLMAALDSGQPLGWLDFLGAGMWLAAIVFEAGGGPAARPLQGRSGPSRTRHGPGPVGLEPASQLFRRVPGLVGGLAGRGRRRRGLDAGVAPAHDPAAAARFRRRPCWEKDLVERRPAYRDYMARTSAFVPWPPKRGAARATESA
jgi:steroid 5-alpha reductase family enzyme